VKHLLSVRDEDTLIRSHRSASTSEIGKKILSPERELILPPLKDNDSLSVQPETVRLNGVCTKNMIKNLTEMILKLSEEFGHLRKDNKILCVIFIDMA
jgi:hypothetical protein